MSNAEVLVEVGGPAEFPMGFVDCVEEIGSYDRNMDAPPVLIVARCSWLRLGFASANGDAIE
jgi:hypothetical protein